MKYGKEQWLNVVANFRKGQLLQEAVCGQEQFIKSPIVISPVAKDNYKKLSTCELPHFSGRDCQWDLIWDCVMTDEATRKIVLITAYCTPEDVAVKCLDMSPAHRAELSAAIKKWYGQADPAPWLDRYYGIAEKLLVLKELNNKENQYFDNGWRCEVFIFNFTDSEGVIAATQEQWEEYYDAAWNDLFPNGDEETDLFYNIVFPL
ncbi:MAG: hypothetical protein Q4C00_07740 [Bacillota bacterium]|nr:hypothetical protein [Bacillota bacterium]